MRTPTPSAAPRLDSIACSTSARITIRLRTKTTSPDSAWSKSRTPLTNLSSLWQFAFAIVSRRRADAGIASALWTRRPSAPAIEVSGVRSSWLIVATNSFFRRSISLAAVTSRPMKKCNYSLSDQTPLQASDTIEPLLCT